MFQAHKCFSPPADETPLLRYINLARLISLLETQSIWFAVPSTLDDAWEGVYPQPHYDQDAVAAGFLAAINEAGHSPPSFDEIRNLAKMMVESNVSGAAFRDMNAISCWHAGEYESDALWRLYATSGVAICSSVGRLKESLSSVAEDVYIGSVQYLDHRRTAVPTDNMYWRIVWKRMAFAHEREVRAVTSLGADVFETIREKLYKVPATHTLSSLPKGRYVPVLLDRLITGIRVAPTAPEWLVEAVSRLVRRYGLSCDVARSDLDLNPPRLGDP